MHQVIDEITQSNSWRDGEFAKFKTNSSKIEEKLWCRMCLPMIYAHWEGFVVNSIHIVIKFLNSLELVPSEVKTNLLVFGLGDNYKTLSGKQSFEQRINFTESFNELLNKNLNIPIKLDTKSNLNNNVLKDICNIFTFDYEQFRPNKNTIDRLVKIRNNIAHGENSYVLDMSNIEKYIDTVSNNMDILLDQIHLFIEERKYLAN